MDIPINVVNQKLRISSAMQNVVAGSQHFVRFKFTLEPEWSSLTKVAQFWQDGKAYRVSLDENNSAYLPPEIKAGICKLMLYGSNETTVGTTHYLTFQVEESIFVPDTSNNGGS